jgi:predicted permease
MMLSGIVLVIACLNLANMLLARGAARRKELAVRIAIGAARSRVVRQLLTESALLAGAGAILGLVFSYWATRTFTSSLTSGLPFQLTLSAAPDVPVLAVTIACATLGTIAFGLGPALGLSRRDLVADLKDRSGDGARSGRRVNVRNALVAAQIALSLTLLTAGGIFARTTTQAAAGRPGYAYDHLILGLADTKLAGVEDTHIAPTYQEILARVRAMPGVTAASIASNVPFGDSQEGRSMERIGPSDRGPARVRGYRVIGADYFRMLGLSMRRGREFTALEESSSGAPAVALIDEALARELFEGVDPIGQMIRVARDPRDHESVAGEPMEIVGIAPPLREEMLQRAPVSHVYVPSGRDVRSGMYVQVRLARGADARAALDGLRVQIREVNAAMPILRLTSMQAFHDSSLELWALKATAYAFTLLGALAMLLAAVGVYGVRAYTVALRTREFGIRMALGASPGRVLGLVLRDGAVLTAVGLALGLPLGLVVSLGLRSVFVDVGGIDLVVLAASMLVLAVAATLAGAVPARRATRIEPVKALSAE